MRTIVYIDWFNLYYGIIEKSGYRWVNLSTLFNSILKSRHNIVAIKFFTANLLVIGNNHTVKKEQENFHRALSIFNPEIEMFFGKFIEKTVRISPTLNAPLSKTIEFNTFEEKETDVNLAVEMMSDFYLNKFDCAVLVSNDSDFSSVLNKIHSQSSKSIGLITPGKQTRASFRLSRFATFKRRIALSHLKDNQLPNQIPNSNIIKPPRW